MSFDSDLYFDNMEIQYSKDGTNYSTDRYAVVVPANETGLQGVNYWIKISIIKKSKSASFTGDFRWVLNGYDKTVVGNDLYESLTTLEFSGDNGTYAASVSGNDYTGELVFPSQIDSYPVTKIVENTSMTSTQKAGITRVYIPSTVTEIGDNAFKDYTELLMVEIESTASTSSATIQTAGAGLKTIGENAFSGCLKMVSINIPSTVKTIGNCAFENCVALTQLNIPNGLISFGSHVYYNCTSLTTITVPECVTEKIVLYGLKNLTGVYFEGGVCKVTICVTLYEPIPDIGNDYSTVGEIDIPNNSAEENYQLITEKTAFLGESYYISLENIKYALSKSVAVAYNGDIIAAGKFIGSSIQLQAQITPSYAKDQSVTWALTSGNSIANISSNGLLTFTGLGSVTVRVTTNDTGVTGEATLTHVDQITNLKVYDSNNSLITSSATGSTPRIDVPATADKNMDIRVELDVSGILDADAVSIDDVTVTTEANYSYNSMSAIRNASSKNLFTIQESRTNEGHGGTVTIAYKNTSATFEMYYYYLEGLMSNNTRYGLEGKRVYAARSYSAGSVVSTIDLLDVVTRIPEQNHDVVNCSIENGTDYVSLVYNTLITTENNSVVHNNIKLQLKTVPYEDEAITIKIWGGGSEIRYSFVLLGSSYGILNVYDQEGLNYALTNGHVMALQRSLGTSEDGEDYSPLTHIDTMESSTKIRFGKMIYGNGFTLNFNALKTGDTFNVMFHNTRNLVVKGENASTSKDYTNVIGFVGSHTYCKVLQCDKVWTFASTESTNINIKNCIFKNTNHCGLQIGSESVGSVYLENTIFADVGQAAVESQNGKLYIKGIFDVYNFRAASEFKTDSLSLSSSTVSSAIKDAYNSTDFANYVTTNSNGDKVANIAILMPPNTTKPKSTEVYFYSGSGYSLLSSSTDTTTGLNYKQISYSKTVLSATIYEICLVLPPKTNTIKPDTVLNQAGESKVYG